MVDWPYYGGYGPTVGILAWTAFTLSTLQMIGRIIVMYTLPNNNGGWSLLFAGLAWLLSTITNILGLYTMYYGLGYDVEQLAQLPGPVLSKAIYIEWIAANMCNYASFVGRLSAVLLVFTILGPTHKLGRYVISFIVAMNGIIYLVTTAAIYTQCTPRAKLWDPQLPGKCPGGPWAYRWSVFMGSWSAFADASIALYPAYVIYHLQIRIVLKVLICGLMGLGLFAAACSIMKTVMLRDIKDAYFAHLNIWAGAEMWVVLITSSFPPLQPLFRDWAKKQGEWRHRLLRIVFGCSEFHILSRAVQRKPKPMAKTKAASGAPSNLQHQRRTCWMNR